MWSILDKHLKTNDIPRILVESARVYESQAVIRQGETAGTLNWLLERRGEPSHVVQLAAEGKISQTAHAWLKERERPGLSNLGTSILLVKQLQWQ